ncbi:DUF86 domain-containing protein [Candidatus Acetothermia bacterium]|jgi:uncharacterized protein with HEPN domain|nr:DUF86 domain-containing protein [Candidatus Acetothermia bacterium]MCI2432634.1 DUF86 domain-containing protein [Candidatus Acetothermia bacterium]MCI2437442.1 DUF86 domain-containing protein [Candidatus Acetothermia bacterium]
MKPKRDFIDYLKDIYNAIDEIQSFTSGMDFEQFSGDKKTVYAVIRTFEIIGEATKNIPPAVRRNYSEVPWKKMAGMRDKMIHEYFGVDLEVVWKTVQEDTPALKPLIEQVIQQELRKESNPDK